MTPVAAPFAPLKLLIDTNVFLALESFSDSRDVHSDDAVEFMRRAGEVGAQVVVASGTKRDLLNAPPHRRKQRELQLRKYVVLNDVPIRQGLVTEAGYVADSSANDMVDLSVLAALDAGAADWLVTQDSSLRKHAANAGYAERIFSLASASETLGSFLRKPTTLPSVSTVEGYEVDIDSEIFQSIKEQYPASAEDRGFEQWWKERVAREPRDVLVLGSPKDPEGVAALKVEVDSPHGLKGRTLKVSTFKISERFARSRRGELLLNAIVDYARRNECHGIYMEVFPENEILESWLPMFGFSKLEGARTERGELVFSKELIPAGDDFDLEALSFNVAFGPGNVRIQSPYLIPIHHRFHQRLFPEAERQRDLFPRQEPSGNAIRKAYLCHAPIRRIMPGDTLIFLRTGTKHGSTATTIGVTESTIVSSSSEEIMTFVGNRTVYSLQEINQLAARSVLAIRFRLDRVIDPPWSRTELQTAGVLRTIPQTIQSIREEGVPWIHRRLGVWP